jgi:hypothetical protein
MGESFDDYLDRIYSDEHMAKESKKDRTAIEKTLKRLEKSTEKLESIDKEIAKNLDDLAKSSRRKTFDVLTPPGTTDIFNAETGEWESVYEKMVDRPPENVYEAMAPVRDRPEAMPLGTPAGTTDIFDIETGEWTALTKTGEDEQTEQEINSLINQLSRPKVKEGQAWRKSAEDELKTALALEEETTVLDEEEDESVFQKVIAETLGLPVDTINAVISSILRAAGAPQHIIEKPVGGRAWLMENKGLTIDGLVEQIAEMLTPTTSSGVVTPATVDTEWPTIPSVQDTQATVMDEGILAGLGMTAAESIAGTRALNESNAIKAEIELAAWKEYEANKQPLVQEQDYNLSDALEGLSQAMQDILNADPELMAQYLAARDDIVAQLNKTGYKEHEDWYPGSQAAATQAGFWGPMALGWNPKYNEYKDAQRELMGLQAGQKFDSDDWISTFGWMTPEQINRISGYGNE